GAIPTGKYGCAPECGSRRVRESGRGQDSDTVDALFASSTAASREDRFELYIGPGARRERVGAGASDDRTVASEEEQSERILSHVALDAAARIRECDGRLRGHRQGDVHSLPADHRAKTSQEWSTKAGLEKCGR